MPQIQNVVGQQIQIDGQPSAQRAGRDGGLVVTELHGKYYEQASRGGLFIGVSAVGGIALIAPAASGGHPTLWNPFGSGVNLSLVRLALSYVSGTNAPTAIEWAKTLLAGSALGTGAPIATFTDVTPVSALVGGAGVAKGRWAPTINTFTAAPTYHMPTGLALDTMAAASTNAPFSLIVDYDGTCPIAPGAALSLCAQAATTTALFQVSVIWEEVSV